MTERARTKRSVRELLKVVQADLMMHPSTLRALRLRKRRRVTGAWVGLVAFAGCAAPVAPLHGDRYVLESISGVPLPAPYAQNPDHDRRIVADTIAFVSPAAGERRTVFEPDDTGKTSRARAVFAYNRQGDRVEIEFPCPPDASCVAGPHLIGMLSQSGLVISESRVSRYPLVFRRLKESD